MDDLQSIDNALEIAARAIGKCHDIDPAGEVYTALHALWSAVHTLRNLYEG